MKPIIFEEGPDVPPTESVRAIAESLSRKCHQEFVALPTLMATIKKSMPEANAEELRKATLEVARIILDDPDITVGQFSDVDFEEWEGTSSTAIERMAAAWSLLNAGETETDETIWFAKHDLEFEAAGRSADMSPPKSSNRATVDTIAIFVGVATAAVLFTIQLLRDVNLGNLTVPLIVVGSFLFSFLAIGRAVFALFRRDGNQSQALRTAYIAIVVGWFYIPYLADGAPTTMEVMRTDHAAHHLFGTGLPGKIWALSFLSWMLAVVVGLPVTLLLAAFQYWTKRTVSRETLAWFLLLAVSLAVIWFGGSAADWVLD